MIINETLARAAFGTDDPIGKRISCCEGGPGKPHWKTVVGVVADVKSRGPAQAARPEFYLPLMQIPDVAWTWMGRSLVDPDARRRCRVDDDGDSLVGQGARQHAAGLRDPHDGRGPAAGSWRRRASTRC